MQNIPFDIEFVRKQFPALQKDFIFMDNAGGSQVLQGVIDRWAEYVQHYNVQLGAGYSISANAGALLQESSTRLAEMIRANEKEELILGPSTTALLRILSLCISKSWKPGDEIIVSNTDHEANVSCWTDLEKQGFQLKIWKMNPENFALEIDDLKALMTEKTRLVALTHCSNILGTINPIKEIGDIVHDAGALICVDGVAFAPHRKIDVQELDVDFYAYSFYKTYGPHAAVLYGKRNLLEAMPGINHYFINDVPYKFQPGNFNFEMCYAMQAIPEYWEKLHDRHFPSTSENKITVSMDLVANYEMELSNVLLEYLNSKSMIRIIGSTSAQKAKRVSTISFVHQTLKSDAITRHTDNFGIGIRYGDFYAKKLVHGLGLEDKAGVVRISMVHYNTKEEVNALIEAFEKIF